MADNRVHCEGGFTGLSVTDDQFPLTFADRHQCVDRLNPGMKRLRDGGALQNSRRFALDGAALPRADLPLTVNGMPQRIHHSAKQCFAHRYGSNLAHTPHTAAAFDMRVIAVNHAPDFAGLNVQYHPAVSAGKLHHLAVHNVGKTVHPADSVRNRQDSAELVGEDLLVHRVQILPQFRGKARRVLRALDAVFLHPVLHLIQALGHGAIIHRVADTKAKPAQQVRVFLDPKRGFAPHRRQHPVGVFLHLPHQLLREQECGSQRDVQHVMRFQIGNVTGGQLHFFQNISHHLRLFLPQSRGIRLGVQHP